MKILKLIIFFSILNVNTYSQTKAYYRIASSTGDYDLKLSKLKKISNPLPKDYEGEYDFGESEAEETVYIMFSNNRFFAVGKGLEYYENKAPERKTYTYKISYKNGVLKLFELEFELYNYTENHIEFKKNTEGIVSKIELDGEDCLVFKNKRKINKPKGDFPEGSFLKLDKEILKTYTKEELKIMRNEIFARNGNTFSGGNLEKYFSNKSWYKGVKEVKINELSDIEKHNIKIIKELEK